MKNNNNLFSETHILSSSSPFFIQEAYKSARTNINFALATTVGCRKIVITSACPNDGKTTSCINLAIATAQTNSRVLIIDADMRKPKIHKYLGLKNATGLSNVLGGFTQLDEVIKKTHFGFDCMTSGPTPPNPAELMMSSVMNDLLELLSKHYDYIIIDTPPVNIVSDVLAVVDKASGVLITVRHGETTHSELKKAISSLQFANAKILGIFYNGVNRSASSHSRSKSYKYKNYYYE
jgi:capsular exopolysaccharide synthesis family protein